MPLRGMDFSQSNRAFSRFNQFLQYDLLDQMKTDRDVQVLGVADRLMREREAQKGGVEMGIAQFKSALTDKEAYTKAMLDIAKLPGMDYRVAMARLATDPNLPPEYHANALKAAKEYADMVRPLAAAAYDASRGTSTWDDYSNILEGMGTKGLMDMTQETGTNIRAKTTADLEAQKIGVERLKATKGTVDEQRKQYLDWIDKSIAHIDAHGVVGNAIVQTAMFLTTGRAVNPLDEKTFGQVLQDLNTLKTKVLHGEQLTPQNERYIQRIWNTAQIKGAETPGTSGTAGAQAVAPAAAAGGLPNPETGVTASGEATVQTEKRTALIAHYTELYLQQVYGGQRTPANIQAATQSATEFVDTMVYPVKK